MLAVSKASWRHRGTWPVFGAKSHATNDGFWYFITAHMVNLCVHILLHMCTCTLDLCCTRCCRRSTCCCTSKGHSSDACAHLNALLQPPVQFSVSLALFGSLGGAPFSWQGLSFLDWGSFLFGAFVLVLG